LIPGKYLFTHVSNKDLGRIKSPLDNLVLKVTKFYSKEYLQYCRYYAILAG